MSFIDFETPIPPRKGDSLFRDDLPDRQNNACLSVNWSDNEFLYTEGYRRAAQLLVEHTVEHQGNKHFLVYPVVFLYRHHIELALKKLILHAPYIIGHQLTDTEMQHLGKHRLDLLWQDLKPMLAAVCKAAGWGTLSSADEEGINSYISQLTALDPESYSFRYTHSKSGAPSLPSEKRINIRHFAEMMERLADYLDRLDTAVGVLEEAKMEAYT
jgi:hypothetical protein